MINLKDTVPVLLRLPEADVSRHRGYMVHREVGAEMWTVSAACGVRVAAFALRSDAERAMRRFSEVLDIDTWPTDDLHRVMVLWDRVPQETRDAMRKIIDEESE